MSCLTPAQRMEGLAWSTHRYVQRGTLLQQPPLLGCTSRLLQRFGVQLPLVTNEVLTACRTAAGSLPGTACAPSWRMKRELRKTKIIENRPSTDGCKAGKTWPVRAARAVLIDMQLKYA